MQVDVDDHSVPVVRHALVLRLQTVRNQTLALKLAKERHLNNDERWLLPPQLQKATREELIEQIDPWISLELTLESLIKQFTPPLPHSHQAITCLTAEQVLELTANEVQAVRIMEARGLIGECADTYSVMHEEHPADWHDEYKWPWMKGACPEIAAFVVKAKRFGILV